MFRLSRKSWTVVAKWLKLANRDFCPGVNKYVYWLKTPVGWFAVAAFASALVGLTASPTGWFLCAVFIAVMAIGVVWPWVAISGVSAQIVFANKRGREEAPVDTQLIVSNWRPWPVWGLLVEGGLQENVRDDQQPITALCRIGPWSSASFAFTFTPSRRGVYPTRQPRLSTGFPFGLWSASRPVTVEQHITIWPRSIPMDALPAATSRRSVTGRPTPLSGEDGDVIGARPYRQGDSLRCVNWGQTARRNALIVRERESFASEECTIRLNPEVFHSAAQSDVVDWGMRAVVGVCDTMRRRSAVIYLELNGRLQPVPVSKEGYAFVLDKLAVFRPDCDSKLSKKCYGPNTVFITTTNVLSSLKGSTSRVVVLDLPEDESFCDEGFVMPKASRRTSASSLSHSARSRSIHIEVEPVIASTCEAGK